VASGVIRDEFAQVAT